MVRIERNSTDTNAQLQINCSMEAKTYLFHRDDSNYLLRAIFLCHSLDKTSFDLYRNELKAKEH